MPSKLAGDNRRGNARGGQKDRIRGVAEDGGESPEWPAHSGGQPMAVQERSLSAGRNATGTAAAAAAASVIASAATGGTATAGSSAASAALPGAASAKSFGLPPLSPRAGGTPPTSSPPHLSPPHLSPSYGAKSPIFGSPLPSPLAFRPAAVRTPQASDYYRDLGSEGDDEGEARNPQVYGPCMACVLGRPFESIRSTYVVRDDRELGRGNFGVIRVCESRATGEVFAVKSIDKKSLEVRCGWVGFGYIVKYNGSK